MADMRIQKTRATEIVRSPHLSASDPSDQMALWLTAAALKLDIWVQAEFPQIALRHAWLGTYRKAAEKRAPDLAPDALMSLLTLFEGLESKGQEPHPMTRAANCLGLSDDQRLAYALSALAEEDARVGALLAELQGTREGYPSTDTLAQALVGPTPPLGAGRDLVGPLLSSGLLVETDATLPRARRVLAPAPLAWDIARGCRSPQWPPGARLLRRHAARRIEDLPYRTAFRDRLSRIPSATAKLDAPVIVLRHMPGTDTQDIASTIARSLQRDLLVVPETHLTDKPPNRELEAAALLTGAALYREVDLAPGETFDLPKSDHDKGVTILALGRSGGLSAETAERAITIDVPFPGASERARAWREALGTEKVDGLDDIRDRFQLPLGHIRRAARAASGEAALAGRETIQPDDARAAIRSLGREQLDTLADFIPAKDDWRDLVVPEQTRGLLDEFAQRCTNREKLCERLERGTAERGVRGLFSGPSGTGKTLAARLLGGEIGTDVYRLNLSAVVDKYVGETEKRLDQLFARAEALDVILLLDEGDGLMAQRTDVRSANDRFANLETNFLLQRLESHAGIVVVTTNMPDGIDPAFQRRMDVVVQFPRPTADIRLALWNLHLPKDHQVADDDLRQLATLAPLTGGQIRNAVRTALSLTISKQIALTSSCLQRGIDLELQKAGGMSGTSSHGRKGPKAQIGLPDFGALLKGNTT